MNEAVSAALDERQQRVATAVLAEEGAKRRHLVVALSGSHAYGFPSPDSDLDLKAIHIEPTERLLGLGSPRLGADRLEVVDEVEIDYTSNEIQPVLSSVLSGNGNYLERILGALLVEQRSELNALAELVQASMSQNTYNHYRGFAHSQFRAVQDHPTTTAKKVLYVLRTSLTGCHLLRTGRLVVNVTELLDDYDFADARDLIEFKQNGERVELSEAQTEHWRDRLSGSFEALEIARRESKLPETPPNKADLNHWLVELRRADLASDL